MYIDIYRNALKFDGFVVEFQFLVAFVRGVCANMTAGHLPSYLEFRIMSTYSKIGIPKLEARSVGNRFDSVCMCVCVWVRNRI